MKYIRLKSTDPYLNLAIEEYLMKHTEDDVFMLWQNEPSVVIGKNQNAYAEVETDYAKRRGIHVVRRITGGGAVYHDLKNLNYSFITASNAEAGLDFAHFTAPIIAALGELGVVAALNGRNDLECDGRKISGSAQFGTNGRTLHHGTLLFDTDLEEMTSVLRVDKEKLTYHAVKSHKSRVANLRQLLPAEIGLPELIAHIEAYAIRQLGATPCEAPDNEIVADLRARNASEDWILSTRRFLTEYAVTRRQKYPFGLVQVEMTLCKSIIESIRISGDFFGTKPIEELEQLLQGRDVRTLDICPSPYINQMTAAELADLLKE